VAKIPDFQPAKQSLATPIVLPPLSQWTLFRLGDLGRFAKGERFRSEDMDEGAIAYVGASEFENGITQRCDKSPNHTLHPPGCITISYNGSIGNAFLQTEQFYAGDDCNVLYPSTTSNLAKLFLCTRSPSGGLSLQLRTKVAP
jgi:hypothetical protein